MTKAAKIWKVIEYTEGENNKEFFPEGDDAFLISEDDGKKWAITGVPTGDRFDQHQWQIHPIRGKSPSGLVVHLVLHLIRGTREISCHLVEPLPA